MPFTKIELASSTLCIARDPFSATWNQAQDVCNDLYVGASPCTHLQVRRACNNGGLTLVASTWLADRPADDAGLFVNQADCNNFDGSTGVGTTLQATYCCLEWMKY